jgi:hypothetical protein
MKMKKELFALLISPAETLTGHWDLIASQSENYLLDLVAKQDLTKEWFITTVDQIAALLQEHWKAKGGG